MRCLLGWHRWVGLRYLNADDGWLVAPRCKRCNRPRWKDYTT